MTRMTIASTNARIDSIESKLDTLLDALVAQPAVPVVETPKATSKKSDEAFIAKFQTQLPRAVALAKKTGAEAKLAAVPGKSGTAIWYMGSNRKVPARGTLLATCRPDGTIKTHVMGLDALVKVS